MTAKPTRDTPGGSAYLDLRKLANATRRPTDELHQLYALEGFLDRLASKVHADSLVLKGGVLLAALDLHRPTRYIDFAATNIEGDLNGLFSVSMDIEAIRDEDLYPGARAKIIGSLATANIRFHIDYNLGDPLAPQPERLCCIDASPHPPRRLQRCLSTRNLP